MNIDIFSVLVVAIYIYILTVVKNLDYIKIGAMTLGLIVLLNMRSNLVEPYTLNTQNNALLEHVNDTHHENESQNKNNLSTPKTNTYSSNMSKLDGLCLTTGNTDDWMKSPSNLKLNSDKDLYNIQGHTNPNKPLLSDPTSLNGPSIDGNNSSPHKLFMLANNKVSPDCCPSTYSTSNGCICSTKEQRDYIRKRGNNVSRCSSSGI